MRPRLRTFLAATVTVLAALLVWVALTTPNRLFELHPAAFVRLPVEALVYVALVLVVPARARTPVALVAGVVLGVLTVLRVLDMAFFEALNRPFHVAVDWRYGRSLVELMRDSFGETAGTVMLVVAAVVLVALLVLIPLALLRVTRLLARHRRTSLRTVAALAAGWVVLAIAGLQVSGTAVASDGSARYAYDQVTGIPAAIRDQQDFEKATRSDPLDDDADGRPAARPGRQGRAVRVRGELRPGRRPGLLVLPRGRPGPRRGHAAGWSRRGSAPGARSSPRRPSGRSAGSRTPRWRRGSG